MIKQFFSIVFIFIIITMTAQTTTSKPSIITIPIEIPLLEIEKLINKSVDGLIFEDNYYTDNKNDNFKSKVWKNGNITLAEKSSTEIQISVPLKIWAEKGYSVLGLTTYKSTEFTVIMKFSSTLELLKNWKLKSKTQSNGFSWIEKPSLNFGIVKIPISSFVEKSLLENQTKFSIKIDEQIQNKFNLSENLIAVWNIFSSSAQVSVEYNTWLQIVPQKINATAVKIEKNTIKTQLGVEVFTKTFTNEKPLDALKISSLPDAEILKSTSNTFNINTESFIPYAYATQLAENQFKNKEFDFQNKKYKVKVDSIKVYGDTNRMVIETAISGDTKGTLVVKGIPYYNSILKKIMMKDTQVKYKTTNVLHKAASWIYKGKLIDLIEKDYGIPTQEMEKITLKNLTESFNKEYIKGVKLSGKIFEISPNSIVIQANHLVVNTFIQAQLKLIVDGFF